MGLAISVFPLYQGKKIIGAAAVYRDISEPIESMRKYEQIAKRYGNVLRIQHHAKNMLSDIIGESPAILRTKSEIRKVARGRSSVLLRGESGTGKELFASALHNASPCAAEPFVAINCPSLPESLAESELFGYEGGAFSGALKGGKEGLLGIADGGTVFLDEIGDLSLSMQAKILRVLETGEFFRVGGTKPIHVNVRLISATNRDLESMIAKGEFREDLYFRLSVITIDIPPLRERGRDILALAHYFIQNEAQDTKVLSPEVEDFFLHYPWPGNVRQLKNTIITMINFAEDETLRIEHLPQNLQTIFRKGGGITQAPPPAVEPSVPFAHLYGNQLREAQTLSRLLDECGYSVEGKRLAAKKYGVSLSTLYNKLRQYGIGKK